MPEALTICKELYDVIPLEGTKLYDYEVRKMILAFDGSYH